MEKVMVNHWSGDYLYTLELAPFDWEEYLMRCGWTALNNIDRDNLPTIHKHVIKRLMEQESIQSNHSGAEWWNSRTVAKYCTKGYWEMKFGFGLPIGKRIKTKDGRTGTVAGYIPADNPDYHVVDATRCLGAFKGQKQTEVVERSMIA